MARKALIHKNTNQTTNNGGVLSPKLPTVGTLQKGEIAVNYKNGYETLSIENDQGEVVPFASLEQIMSYVDNSLPDLELSSNYSTSDLENENLQLAEGDSYEEAFSKLEKAILDNEETIASSLNDLNTRKIEIDDVPTKTSQLTNDSGFLTSHQQLKTINNESLIGSGNITIQGGGGDTNIIETIKVNGTALTPDSNKAVDITVPAAITESTVSGWGFTKNTGTYSKPNGGIPKSDLTNDVQISLGKADTALQSFTESDPTVPSHVKEITTTDISNWNNKLSSAPVTSVNGQTGAVTLALGDTNIIETVKVNNTALTPSSKAVNITVPTKVSDLTNDSGFITSAPVTSVNGQTGAVSLTIPTAVTESTVSGWGFTKNAGTITGITMNGSSKGTSGVVNLGTVITSETNLSKGTTSGSGNAVTDISVSGHTITLTKGSTFLTSHQNIKTINNNSLVGTGNVSIDTLPTVTASDNGKVLQVVNGTWSLVMPTAIYSGTSTPSNSTGNNGDLYLQTS